MLKGRFFPYSTDEEYFLFDTDTGLVFDSTMPVNETITLINSGCDKQKEDIKGYIEALMALTDKLRDRDGSYLLRKSRKITDSQWFAGKVLHKMWLSLTHSCNMRCSYCFGGYGYNPRNSMMNVETAQKCIDYFFKYANRGVKRFNVQFFGGEPLLNKDVFIFATEYINQKASEMNKDVHYIFTTNGTLLDNDILDIVIKNNMYMNISIDGSESIHNRNRRFANGDGTFGKIIHNISKIRERSYDNIIARVTLTKPGVLTLKEDIKFIWDIGFNHIFIDIVKTDIKELALDESSLDLLRNQFDQITEIMKEEYLRGTPKLVRNITDMHGIIENRIIKSECMYFNPFTIQFTPEGDIYKCCFTVREKDECVGNVRDGIIWNKFKKDFKPDDECFNCWAKRLCGGGCPLNKDKNIDCEFTKIIIENSLKYYSFLKKNLPKIPANIKNA